MCICCQPPCHMFVTRYMYLQPWQQINDGLLNECMYVLYVYVKMICVVIYHIHVYCNVLVIKINS